MAPPNPETPEQPPARTGIWSWIPGPRRPTVTVIRLAGTIGVGAGLRGRPMSLAALTGTIDRAFAPRRLAAVALAVNSPGGAPAQAALIARRIRDRADEKRVPVLGFVEDVAASGGYWLACAADEIFADPSSIVGSIGVVSAGFGFHEAIQRLGIERRVHTAGARKGMLDPFRPEDSRDVAELKALQADVHEIFKAYVAERRSGRLGQDPDLFSGAIWSGNRAVKLGLVDGIGHLRPVLRERFGNRVRIKPANRERGWLRGRLGGSLTDLEVGRVLVEDAWSALEDRLAWSRYGL